MSDHSSSSKTAGPPALPPVSLGSSLQPPISNEQGNGRFDLKKSSEIDQIQVPRHRFLTEAEWTILARGVGAIRDAEENALVTPTSWWWPAKGLPPGLYADVIRRRSLCFYFFHLASTVRWGLLVAQLVLGASLTALGAFSFANGISITVLGAANTVIAGLLALLHNSGLPDRYRYDMAEFEEVEDHIKEILTTRLVRADLTLDQVLAQCYDLFHDAKTTVEANMPATYTPSQATPVGRGSVSSAAHGTVTPPKPAKTSSEDDQSPTRPGK
ncbi:hypothetical protein ACHAPT_005169 [Fusarium lateritium]